jgi:hypothetical protein
VYHAFSTDPVKVEKPDQKLVLEVPVPLSGDYTADATVNLERPANGATGDIKCELHYIGRPDRVSLTLAPGQSAGLSLISVGTPAQPTPLGPRHPLVICTGHAPYVIESARLVLTASRPATSGH